MYMMRTYHYFTFSVITNISFGQNNLSVILLGSVCKQDTLISGAANTNQLHQVLNVFRDQLRPS